MLGIIFIYHDYVYYYHHYEILMEILKNNMLLLHNTFWIELPKWNWKFLLQRNNRLAHHQNEVSFHIRLSCQFFASLRFK